MNDTDVQPSSAVQRSSKQLPPIFVLGYMHSGTTMLHKILGKHSSILSSGGETKIFEFLSIIRNKFPSLEDEADRRRLIEFSVLVFSRGYKLVDQPTHNTVHKLSDAEIDRLIEQTCSEKNYIKIIGAVFDTLTQKQGKNRWLEKTPTHVFHIDAIIDVFPDVRLVEIVRDSRDVLASKRTRRETVWSTERYVESERKRKHFEKAYDPLWDSLSWGAAIRAGLTAHDRYPKRLLTIRYEDLVADPETTVREICDFLGLAFEPEMLLIDSRNSAQWEGLPLDTPVGIVSDSVGRWKQALPAKDVAVCQWFVKDLLRKHRYPIQPISLGQKGLAAVRCVGSCGEFAARLHRRWRLGGTVYLLSVLKNYRTRLGHLRGRATG